MKDATQDMVEECFGSWKALAKERPELFYVEQGAIRLRKVAGAKAASAAPAPVTGTSAGGKKRGGKKNK